MTAARVDPMVKGWCPGVLRPMETGDGLIVRLRISGGVISLRLAEQIAGWSQRWGNGQIDLSVRANLQLRGLSMQYLPKLLDALAEWDLLDDSEAGEAVQNVISTPLAGLDPSTVLDVRPVVLDLERRLLSNISLHSLPGKFGFAIDDGGLLSLDDVAADVRFVARDTVDGPHFEISLAGAPHNCFGPCSPNEVADVAEALSRVFLRLRIGRETKIRRMRDLVVAYGAETIGHLADLATVDVRRLARMVHPSNFLGVHALGMASFVGIGLPFGRVTADDLTALAAAATAYGAQETRLTPWRAVLIPVPSIALAHGLLAGLEQSSFVLDPGDPRRRVAACPGAPSCTHATTPVRSYAADVATEIVDVPGWGIVVHVSGCEKGCAHPAPAPVTLVGRAGHYDLVRNGVASSPPVLRGLTADQAAEQVQYIVADQLREGAA